MKKKTAFTLVEVLVSLVVFATIFAVTLSLYRTITSYTKKQEEYAYFEAVCLDIDKLYDNYGKDEWTSKFSSTINPKEETIEIEGEPATSITYYNYYYTSSYFITDDTSISSHYMYKLSYHYDNNNLIVDIYNTSGNYQIIKSLNYGLPSNIN